MKKLYYRLALIFLLSAILLAFGLAVTLYTQSLAENTVYLNQLLDSVEANYATTEQEYRVRIEILKEDYLHRAQAAEYIISGMTPALSQTGLSLLRDIMEVKEISLIDRSGRIVLSTCTESGTEYSEKEELETLLEQNTDSLVTVDPEVLQFHVTVPSSSDNFAALRIDADAAHLNLSTKNELMKATIRQATTEYGTAIAAIERDSGQVLAITRNNDQEFEISGIQTQEALLELLDSAEGETAQILRLNSQLQNIVIRDSEEVYLTSFSSMETILSRTALAFWSGILGIGAVLTGMLLLIRFWINKYLFAHFAKMKQGIRRLIERGENAEIGDNGIPELKPLISSIAELGREYMDQSEGISRMEDELSLAQTAAKYDKLTGLYNRNGFESLADEFLKAPSPAGVFLLFDLDNFKRINDSEGHPEGDRVLERFAELLNAGFRQSDIIGRLGGDEFVVLITNPMPETILREKFDYILSGVRAALGSYYEKYSASVSIGAVPIDGTIRNYTGLYKCADTALYIAKYLGKDRYYINTRKISCMKRECIGCRENCPRSRLLNLSHKDGRKNDED